MTAGEVIAKPKILVVMALVTRSTGWEPPETDLLDDWLPRMLSSIDTWPPAPNPAWSPDDFLGGSPKSHKPSSSLTQLFPSAERQRRSSLEELRITIGVHGSDAILAIGVATGSIRKLIVMSMPGAESAAGCELVVMVKAQWTAVVRTRDAH